MASVKTLSGLHDVCKNKNNVRNIFPTHFQVFTHSQFFSATSSYPLRFLIQNCLFLRIHCDFLSNASSYLLPVLIYLKFLSTALSYPLLVIIYFQFLVTASSYFLQVLIYCHILSTALPYPHYPVLTYTVTANSYPMPVLIHNC